MNKEIIKLDIIGMTCDHCATGIEKLLSKNEGVKEANVSYPKATCECSFDPTKTSKEEIINTICIFCFIRTPIPDLSGHFLGLQFFQK